LKAESSAPALVLSGRRVPQVLGQRLSQVVLIEHQQPVEKLPAQGTYDPFADGVRSRRLRRAGKNPDAFRGEHGVEAGGELAGRDL
jgi:hypothetical protein